MTKCKNHRVGLPRRDGPVKIHPPINPFTSTPRNPKASVNPLTGTFGNTQALVNRFTGTLGKTKVPVNFFTGTLEKAKALVNAARAVFGYGVGGVAGSASASGCEVGSTEKSK